LAVTTTSAAGISPHYLSADIHLASEHGRCLKTQKDISALVPKCPDTLAPMC